MDAGVSFPSTAAATSNFDPLEKSAGAPQSSVSTGYASQQITP